MVVLGVNIDHVATLRNARGGRDPEPLEAARIVRESGGGQLVCHLREDRRHINDRDLMDLTRWGGLPINLEMALTTEMEKIALSVTPQLVTVVPEKRLERTTEGGLVLDRSTTKTLEMFIRQCTEKAIAVSLFLDPDIGMVKKAVDLGVSQIELHTGAYANAFLSGSPEKEVSRLYEVSDLIVSSGIRLALGHGLDRHNLKKVLSIPQVREVNIGHSIIARSVFIGLAAAIAEILDLLRVGGEERQKPCG